MKIVAFTFVVAALAPTAALAENIYRGNTWAAVAGDRSASAVGDILTVVVHQSAEARNAAENNARTRRSFEGALQSGSIDESATLSLDGAYAGRGEVRRSESFVTQISVRIAEVLPNGDFLIAGEQRMHINGERTLVRIRGRVRPADITGGNRILSSRISDAEISYDGQGFASRNARPNLIHRIFSLLGLGG
jgi:flagellar L-ring protein precursor FlgH